MLFINNAFLQYLSQIQDEYDMKEIEEVEDLDELSEIIYCENFSLEDFVKVSMNPFYGFNTWCGITELFKRGIKSEDWLHMKKDKYTKIEEKLILSSI